MTIIHRTRTELGKRPVAEAITTRGKELSPRDTVGVARQLFARQSVQLLPVLEGTTYIGALGWDTIGEEVPADTPVAGFVTRLAPTALATMPTDEALAALDLLGAKRLVVLGEDEATYVGMVCLRGDRERLCVDAECHLEVAEV